MRGARSSLLVAQPLVLVQLLAGCAAEGPPDLRSLNIVLIVFDTLRSDRTSINDPDLRSMPFLGNLATKSVVFERAYSTSSYTAPATASLFTSRYPSKHGVWNGLTATTKRGSPLNRIPQAIETLPELLSRAGYRTFGVADNVNIGEAMGFARGFERFAHFEYASAATVNQTVSTWAEEIRKGGRYFLYLHYMDPHRPYRNRTPWLRPGSGDRHIERLESWGTTTPEERDWAGARLPAYDSELGYADEHVRRLYTLLDWGSNTLLVVTADHGEEFLDHGGRGHGFTVYDELVRVPLLFHYPGVRPRRVHELASVLDVLPTLREAAGLAASPGDTGQSLLPVLRGSPPVERTLFAMRLANWKNEDEPRGVYGAVSQGWKYILERPSGQGQLFDLRRDPAEQRDVRDEHPEVARELEASLAGILSEVSTTRREFGEAPELGDEERQHLHSLGYVE